MTKRALFAGSGLLLFCFSLSAEPAATLSYNSIVRFPALRLSEAGSFSFATAFTQLETTSANFLPTELKVAATTAKPRKAVAASPALYDSSKDIPEMRRPVFDHATGEIGFLYGRSTGKFAGDFEKGYIVGEVGNEHVQISAGASYERSNGRDPRFGR